MLSNEKTRVNKYLRDKGLVSRREADELIAGHKVLVNGVPAKAGMFVNESDTVKLVKDAIKEHRYFAYYKPRGLATQEQGTADSVIAYFKKEKLFPVGRLDKDSEGLMILTDDGRVTTAVLNSENRLQKEYVVTVREKLRKSIPAIFIRNGNKNIR